MEPSSSVVDRERVLVMRLVEELTNKPVGSMAEALEKLFDHFRRYRRAQEAINDSAGFGLADPTHLDVFDACLLLSERYAALTRSIRALEQSRISVRHDGRGAD
jgi:hypothetical protein